ncbi:MAG: MarC family protein [Betaproteobacteria bacterium]|nr:MarC family protein [Betaproteobacteria bacterium]
MSPLLALLIHIFKNALLILAALLPIINPPGAAPPFLLLTQDASQETRHFLARRIALNSTILLLAAMFIGSYVLDYFGISAGTVRVAGGLLVASMAWKMLQTDDQSASGGKTAAVEWSRKIAERRAFYPLTFPLTVGPGSTAVAVTLGASIYRDASRPLAAPFAALVAIAVIALAIYLCLRFADRIVKLLGETGTTVFLRLAAFVLLCIGIEILRSGLFELIEPLLHAAHR